MNTFENSFTLLVQTIKHLIEIYPADSIITKYLNNYIRSYGSKGIPLENHTQFVKNTYDTFRDFILDRGTDFSWVADESVMIVFGSKEEPSPNMRIMFSAFYRHAKRLVAKTEKELIGRPDKEYQGRKELIYPDVMLLYLYRMFQCVAPEEERHRVGSIVSHIESELGIENGSSISTRMESSPLSMVTNMMASLGLKPPDGSAMPNPADFDNVLGKLMNKPEVQQGMKELMNSFKAGTDLSTMIGGVVQKMNDGSLEPMAKVIQKEIEGLEVSSSSSSSSSSSNQIDVKDPPVE